jgi:predicted nucleotidyltransferase
MQFSQPLAVVTPTLDGPVLAVLAMADESFTTGQINRILDRHSEEGIRKVLHRLTDQGIVTTDRVGAAFSYRFNREHLAAQHIVRLADLRTEFLRQLETVLASWSQPPVYAAVFGSAARGAMGAESDIDILLIRQDDGDEALWADQVDGLVQTVSRWTGNDTRPLEYAVHELEAAGREPVLADVLRDGLTVHGRRSWLHAHLRSRRS